MIEYSGTNAPRGMEIPQVAADLIEQQQARIDELEQLLRESAKAADQFYQQRNHAIEKRDELAATVERFRGTIFDYHNKNHDLNILLVAATATLHQNLNAIKREVAIQAVKTACRNMAAGNFDESDFDDFAQQYAHQRYPDGE